MVPERSDSQSLQDLTAAIEEIKSCKLLVYFNCQTVGGSNLFSCCNLIRQGSSISHRAAHLGVSRVALIYILVYSTLTSHFTQASQQS